MLRNNVMLAVTQLLQQADKHLVLTALKFLRQCVGVQEVFYNRYSCAVCTCVPCALGCVVACSRRIKCRRARLSFLSAALRTESCASPSGHELVGGRYIVKKDLFKGVMDLLQRHLHRNNLINSAIIELVDHIRVKNVKELIKYMVDRYVQLASVADAAA